MKWQAEVMPGPFFFSGQATIAGQENTKGRDSRFSPGVPRMVMLITKARQTSRLCLQSHVSSLCMPVIFKIRVGNMVLSRKCCESRPPEHHGSPEAATSQGPPGSCFQEPRCGRTRRTGGPS